MNIRLVAAIIVAVVVFCCRCAVGKELPLAGDLVHSPGPLSYKTTHARTLACDTEEEALDLFDWDSVDPSSTADVDIRGRLNELYADRGLDVYGCVVEEATLLHIAAMRGFTTIGRLLIEASPELLDETAPVHGYHDYEEALPLHFAGMFGRLDFVRMMVDEFGININLAEPTTGVTVALYAAERNDMDMLRFAFEHGHEPDGYELLQPAKYNYLDTVRELVDVWNVPVTAKSHGGIGDTALHAACEEGHIDMVRFLLDRGADPNDLSADNGTPLLRAREGLDGGHSSRDRPPRGSGHDAVVALLESVGARVYNEETKAFFAAKHEAVVKRMNELPREHIPSSQQRGADADAAAGGDDAAAAAAAKDEL